MSSGERGDSEVAYCSVENGSACAVLNGVGAYIVLIPPAIGEINTESVEVVVGTTGCCTCVAVTSVNVDGVLTTGNFCGNETCGVFRGNTFDLAVVELFYGSVSFTNDLGVP